MARNQDLFLKQKFSTNVNFIKNEMRNTRMHIGRRRSVNRSPDFRQTETFGLGERRQIANSICVVQRSNVLSQRWPKEAKGELKK